MCVVVNMFDRNCVRVCFLSVSMAAYIGGWPVFGVIVFRFVYSTFGGSILFDILVTNYVLEQQFVILLISRQLCIMY